jgi:hypothetical protein
MIFLKILEITVTKLDFKRLYSIEDNLEPQYKTKERMPMIVLMKKCILLSGIIISCFLTENVTVLAANNPFRTSSHLLDSMEPIWG